MLIAKEIPDSVSAEAYRMLRTKIRYSSIDKQIKTIVVTAAESGEGKSTVSGNLAVALNQSGSKVIIIDCDLRRPSLHKKFNVSNFRGLTDLVVEECELEDVINIIESDFHLITTGDIPPNPAEILGSKKVETILNKLKNSYDYIIIDTPPLMAVTDGQILAAKGDATILIVRSCKTKSKLVHRAYEELIKVKANVIGTVLNGIERDRNDSYYYSYEEDNKKAFSFKSLFNLKRSKRRKRKRR